jgi:mono/diheme cytochrome c family protein
MERVNNLFIWIITLLTFWACNPAETKLQQYAVEGEALYLQHCSNCHQKNGKGLGLVYPPVDQSDFMDQHLEEVICLIKYGRKGEIIVNGKTYHQPMPGVPSLTELEIAEICTFLYNHWERKNGIIEVATVTKALENCIP